MSWYDDYDELDEVLATHPTPGQIEDALNDGRLPAAYADRARAYAAEARDAPAPRVQDPPTDDPR